MQRCRRTFLFFRFRMAHRYQSCRWDSKHLLTHCTVRSFVFFRIWRYPKVFFVRGYRIFPGNKRTRGLLDLFYAYWLVGSDRLEVPGLLYRYFTKNDETDQNGLCNFMLWLNTRWMRNESIEWSPVWTSRMVECLP